MPSAHLVERSSPPHKSAYRDYREYLRHDFYFACAYCSVAESEAGGVGFHVDHYKPQATKAPDVDDYINLMWSCEHCNSTASKGSFWPTEAQLTAGIRLLRPDADDLLTHYKLDGTELTSDTAEGRTSIIILRLNRRTLIRLRSIRARLYDSRQGVILGLQALNELSIDQCPPELKTKLIKTKKDFGQQEADLKSLVDNFLIKAINRSLFLDEDPAAKNNNTARKAYLESVKAIV